MKIFLVRNMEPPCFPKEIPPVLVLGRNYPENRSEKVISHFMRLSQNNVIPSDDFCVERIKEFPYQVCRTNTLSEYFFYYNKRNDVIYTYKIKQIKSNIPWTIIRSEYGETVHYFDPDESYEITNEETMYSEFKNII